MALATATTAAADALTINFTSGLPKDATTEDGDGGVLQPNIYKHIDEQQATSWIVSRLGDGHGQAALSATRHADKTLAARNLLILPTLTIDSDTTYLRWETKSMHKEIPEKYHVLIRENADLAWDTLYTCQKENYAWTCHVLPLSAYKGTDAQIAFEAATTDGFMLALDNIFIGTPSQDKSMVTVQQTTPRFIGKDDESAISLHITNYGPALQADKIAIVKDGEYAAIAHLPKIEYGQSADITFDIDQIPLHEKYEYTVAAIAETGDITLYDTGWTYRSHYRRTTFVDRGSGTWCNNCPPMEITTSRLQTLYADQLIISESHLGNDVLANGVYLNDYLNDFMRAVPCIVPNHRKDKIKYSVKDTEDLSDLFIEPAIARIDATYTLDDGKISINAECEFAEDTDNSTGQYAAGYMLMADYHDPSVLAYVQSNSASSYTQGQYYYMPSYILPEMMWYVNVPTDCATATKGKPDSMPRTIEAGTPFATSHTMDAPTSQSIISWKVAAYIIDTTDGHIVNATIATENTTGAITAVQADTTPAADLWYNLQGIRLHSRPSTPGIYINNGKKTLIH